MKKRIFSAAIAMATILALMAGISISSFAQTGTEPETETGAANFRIYGTLLKDGVTYINANLPYITNGGSIEVKDNKITLHHVDISFPDKIPENDASSRFNGIALSVADIKGTAIIELDGDNTINGLENNDEDYGVFATTTDVFRPSNLKIVGADNSSRLTINNANIQTGFFNQPCSEMSDGDSETNNKINRIAPNLKISNCKLSVLNENGLYGISTYGNIIFDSAIVNANGGIFGVWAVGGDIEFNNRGLLKAKCSNEGVAAIITYEDITGYEYGDDSMNYIKTGGKIILNDGMKVLEGGNVVEIGESSSNMEILQDDYNFKIQTVGKDEDSVDLNGEKLIGASKYVKIGKMGIFSVKTDNTSSIPSVALSDNETIKNAVLSADEIEELMEGGQNITVNVVIKNAQLPSDASYVINSLGSNTLGMYLDLTMFKTVGDTREQITQLNDNKTIRITLTIPDSLKGYSSYSIIRAHDGVATTLKDLDNDANTITFETDRFSTYALVYSGTKTVADLSIPKASTNGVKTAKTADDSALISLSLTAVASIGAIAYIQKKKF